jgi:CarboxypepD_reg-like domain/TonB-dependent Receptor Plug Domain
MTNLNIQQITRHIITVLFFLTPLSIFAQTGVIEGRVTNKLTKEPLPFVIVQVLGTTRGAETDSNGVYRIAGLECKMHILKAATLGFKKLTFSDIRASKSKPTTLNFELEEERTTILEFIIKASPFKKTEESPVSLRTLGLTEISHAPGASRDISKALQSLPGVAAPAPSRNDLIVRGGAPNENRFYLDDIEVPNINHFTTQGSTGGAFGIINSAFLKEVDFYSGAFPANRGNALSSVINFRQRDGAADKFHYSATLGTTDIGTTVEGPLSKNTTLLFSARRSNLKPLFKALNKVHLPTVNDAQLKIKYKPNDNNEVTYIFMGAIDNLELDTTNRKTELNAYILDYLAIQPQWNYTHGITWKNYDKTGYWTFVASRNVLDNTAYKHLFNNESLPRLYDYKSQESETKLRAERSTRTGKWKLVYGVSYENAHYSNSTSQRLTVRNVTVSINYASNLGINKYGGFVQISRQLAKDKLTLSGGVRVDGNDYNATMQNPFNQISPRFSLAYAFTPQFSFNMNTGIFYQLPPYTMLGYKANGLFVNKPNLTYINARHLVAGFEYNTKSNAKISVEAYMKNYDDYPFLTNSQVSFANLSSGFKVVGNEPANSMSVGRTSGVELLVQQKFYKGFYGILSYTYGRSEFQNAKNEYVASAWDSHHTAVVTMGYQVNRSVEIGIKYRASSGLPYTPDDPRSNMVSVWQATGQATPDYSQLNTLRTNGFNTLDLRIDKKWTNKTKTKTRTFYVDIQNVFNAKQKTPITVLDRPLDSEQKPVGDAFIVKNAAGVDYYKTKVIQFESGIITPTIGLQIEF